MVSDDEPELDAFVHDAHAVFGLDALVAVPDHVLVEHRGELVCFASMFVRHSFL